MHIPESKNPEVTPLIGTDVPEAHWRLEERRECKKEPYAIRTPLGWSVAGLMGNNIWRQSYFIFLLVVKILSLDRQSRRCLKWISVRKRTGRALACL